MTKYILLAILIVVAIGGYFVFFPFTTDINQENTLVLQEDGDQEGLIPTTKTLTENQTQNTNEQKPRGIVGPATTTTDVNEFSESGNKLYRNEEFGFLFEFPNDWNLRIPEWGSSVSLFNMGIKPVEYGGPSYITINITPKQWIENALLQYKSKGGVVEHIIVSGMPASRILDKGQIGESAYHTFILVDDEFWIDITGRKTHEKEYFQILNSFVIK